MAAFLAGAARFLWKLCRKVPAQPCPPEPAAPPVAILPAASPVTVARQMRVLIADDHRMFRFAIEAQLEAAGVDVVGEASTAAEAVASALRLRPDVVLMDIAMPGGGIEATRLLVKEWPAAKVVILTGHDLPGDPGRIVEAMRAGAVDYLHKDNAMDHLVEKLNAVTR